MPTLKTNRRSIECAINLSQRRKWYAEGEGSAETTTETTKTTETSKSESEKPTILQSHMDKAMANLRKETEAKTAERLLKQFGVNPSDEKAIESVKALIAAGQEAEKSKRTAEENAQIEIDKLKKQLDEANSTREKVLQERRLEVRDNGVKAALSDPKLHCKNPDKVFKLLKADHETELAAVLKEDGSLDADKLKALVDLGKKENGEYFTGGGPGIPSNLIGRPAPIEDRAALRRVAVTAQRTNRG